MRNQFTRLFAALLLLIAFDARAALSVVHVGTPASILASSTPQLQWNLSPLPTIGNALIIEWTYTNIIGITGTPTIADNQGTTANWQLVATYLNTDPPHGVASSTAIFLLPNVTSSSGSFQVTVTTPASTAATAHANHIEVHSSTGSIAVDQTGTFGSGTSVINSVTVTASAANANAADLVIAVVSGQTNHTDTYSSPPSTGYTSIMSIGSGGNDNAAGSGYKNVSSIETSSANWTIGTGMEAAAAIATFYASGAPPPSGQSNLLTLGVARNAPKPHPDLSRVAIHEWKRAA